MSSKLQNTTKDHPSSSSKQSSSNKYEYYNVKPRKTGPEIVRVPPEITANRVIRLIEGQRKTTPPPASQQTSPPYCPIPFRAPMFPPMFLPPLRPPWMAPPPCFPMRPLLPPFGCLPPLFPIPQPLLPSVANPQIIPPPLHQLGQSNSRGVEKNPYFNNCNFYVSDSTNTTPNNNSEEEYCNEYPRSGITVPDPRMYLPSRKRMAQWSPNSNSWGSLCDDYSIQQKSRF